MQLRVMELTGALVPQGALVKGVKTGWRLAWRTLMSELAPQSKDGEYVRPSYAFKGEIGTAVLPKAKAAWMQIGRAIARKTDDTGARSLAAQREYWPTKAWRKAAPAAQGFNASALADASRCLRTTSWTRLPRIFPQSETAGKPEALRP